MSKLEKLVMNMLSNIFNYLGVLVHIFSSRFKLMKKIETYIALIYSGNSRIFNKIIPAVLKRLILFF